MVAGGVAVNLYGIERATAVIDLIVNMDKENVSKFVRTVELNPEERQKAAEELRKRVYGNNPPYIRKADRKK